MRFNAVSMDLVGPCSAECGPISTTWWICSDLQWLPSSLLGGETAEAHATPSASENRTGDTKLRAQYFDVRSVSDVIQFPVTDETMQWTIAFKFIGHFLKWANGSLILSCNLVHLERVVGYLNL